MARWLTLATVAAAMLPATADAALYEFDLSGSRSANFRLRSSQPDFASAFQTQFEDVAGSYGGTSGTAGISFGAVFFISALDISGTSLGFTQFAGPPLFTGPTSNPVFTTGTYTLNGIVSGESKLTISAVPEPAAWTMMVAGFGLVGGILRRRSTAVTA